MLLWLNIFFQNVVGCGNCFFFWKYILDWNKFYFLLAPLIITLEFSLQISGHVFMCRLLLFMSKYWCFLRLDQEITDRIEMNGDCKICPLSQWLIRLFICWKYRIIVVIWKPLHIKFSSLEFLWFWIFVNQVSAFKVAHCRIYTYFHWLPCTINGVKVCCALWELEGFFLCSGKGKLCISNVGRM